MKWTVTIRPQPDGGGGDVSLFDHLAFFSHLSARLKVLRPLWNTSATRVGREPPRLASVGRCRRGDVWTRTALAGSASVQEVEDGCGKRTSF